MERTEYTYDDLGRIVKQTDIYKKMTRNSSGGWEQSWVNVDANSYEYDTLGNITKTTDALGNSTVTDYNLAGLPEYVIDAESSYKGTPYTVKYTYNGLGQKVKEAYDGAIYSYTYDGAGNRSTETIQLGEGSVTTTYLYNPQNRLTATLSTSGEESKYIYDNNGNLLTKVSGISLLKSIADAEENKVLPNYGLIIVKDNMIGTGSSDLTRYTYFC